MRLDTNLVLLLTGSVLLACGGSDDQATCGAPPEGVDPASWTLPACPASEVSPEDAYDDPFASDPYYDDVLWAGEYCTSGLDLEVMPDEGAYVPLGNLVQQSVWWANLRVTTVDARVAYADDRARVEVTLQLENHSTREVDYSTRRTWDLVLADGSRLDQCHPMRLRIAPGDTVTTTLTYIGFPEDVFEDAEIELNGDQYSYLEPFRLPLERALPEVHSERVTDLEGKLFMFTDGHSVEIVKARWGENSFLGGRATLGQRLLGVQMRVSTASRQRFYGKDNFRLVAEGNSQEPEFENCPVSMPHDVMDTCAMEFLVHPDVANAALDVIGSGVDERQRAEFSLLGLPAEPSP